MVRSWVRVIWSSVGVAVLAAAAQLGAAEALGVLRWRDHYDPAGGDSWSALLTWVAFIYAVAVLGGATAGRRHAGRKDGAAGRVTAALAAAVGGVAAIPLVMLRARTAVPPVNVHPELWVLVIASAGVVVGLVIAMFALFIPPIAGGVRASVAWVWLAAAASSTAAVVSNQPYPAPRLGVIDAQGLTSLGWWPGTYVMGIAAAVVGLAVALVARWGGAHRAAVALAGVAGPAMMAGAYAIAGPDFDNPAFVASLYAVGAGLLAGLVVAVPGRTDAREEVGPADPTWGEADRYRPGNYLAETRPGDIVGVSPFRTSTSAEGARASTPPEGSGQPSYAARASVPGQTAPEPEPLPTRVGTHRAAGDHAFGAASYLGREFPEHDYPTGEYPAALAGRADAPAPAVMGQPPQSFDDSGSDWLRSLGPSTQRG